MSNWQVKLFISGLVLIIGFWVLGKTITVKKVEGSEAMVRQHLIHGVDDKVLLSGTHFFVRSHAIYCSYWA